MNKERAKEVLTKEREMTEEKIEYYRQRGEDIPSAKEFAQALDLAIESLRRSGPISFEKGKWEYVKKASTPWAVRYYRCSKCHGEISVHGRDNGWGYDYIVKEKYCPNCGAKMEVEDE